MGWRHVAGGVVEQWHWEQESVTPDAELLIPMTMEGKEREGERLCKDKNKTKKIRKDKQHLV